MPPDIHAGSASARGARFPASDPYAETNMSNASTQYGQRRSRADW
jgi:hypothetical protein